MDKPIKKRLLIHNITQEHYKNSDYGDTWIEPKEIKNVRVEPKTKLIRSSTIRSSTGDTITSNTIIFADAIHSTPTTWKEKDRITFNDKQFTVFEVKTYYHGNSNKVHHWELYCL